MAGLGASTGPFATAQRIASLITDSALVQSALSGLGLGGGGAWGSITGTLNNQTDLQAALDALAADIATKQDRPTVQAWTAGQQPPSTPLVAGLTWINTTPSPNEEWISVLQEDGSILWAEVETVDVVPGTRTVGTASGSGLAGGGALSGDLALSVDIDGQTELTSGQVDASADFIMLWDASGSVRRKAKPNNLGITAAALTPQITSVAAVPTNSTRLWPSSRAGASTTFTATAGTTYAHLYAWENKNFTPTRLGCMISGAVASSTIAIAVYACNADMSMGSLIASTSGLSGASIAQVDSAVTFSNWPGNNCLVWVLLNPSGAIQFLASADTGSLLPQRTNSATTTSVLSRSETHGVPASAALSSFAPLATAPLVLMGIA